MNVKFADYVYFFSQEYMLQFWGLCLSVRVDDGVRVLACGKNYDNVIRSKR